MKKTKSRKMNLLMGFVILISSVVIITVIGLWIIKPDPLVLQGEVEASEIRVSGKVPGRVLEIRVQEGIPVKKGDTLVILDSPEVNAKLQQAVAAEEAAEMQNRKAHKGTRQEQVIGAYEQWQKALVGTDLAKKSFDRVQNLYDKGVLPAQKRDEAEANYKAALATSTAAQSQYQMALNGAEKEDKEMAKAMVDRAKGAVAEVESYLPETMLTAPISGEISDIFPKIGELVGTGAPIMNIVDLNDSWMTFNLREDLLSKISMGKRLEVTVPALNNRKVTIEITYIKAMASYANWKATKVSGEYDAKTFEARGKPVGKVEGLRPGMTVLLEWDKVK